MAQKAHSPVNMSTKSRDTAMWGDAEYEGLKKREKLILFVRQSRFLTSCTQLLGGGGGQVLWGGCCFDTNRESEL